MRAIDWLKIILTKVNFWAKVKIRIELIRVNLANMNDTDNNKNNNPFPSMEEAVLVFWDKNKIFEKSVEKEAPRGDYVFYDGPPFATGEPHYGHIVASIMKDAVPRYWTMCGYRVERRWGWDCHGLPVENLAEQELGLKNKQEIEKLGVAKFNNYCKSIVLRYSAEWKKTIRRVGRWVDMENDYKTMDADYMETIWWVFKNLWGKGLVYEDYKAMHICPRCATTLSNFEVTQNYKKIEDLAAVVKFELEDEPGTFVLAWTTTPWTLIGNVALAVNKKETYIKFKITKINYSNKINAKEGETYIFLESAISRIFGTPLGWSEASGLTGLALISNKDFKAEVDVLERPVNIKNLVGKKYKPLFDYFTKDEKLENRKKGWKIYTANFVTTDEGTGIVHIAPAFGEDDMMLGQAENLPFIQHIDMFGRFTAEVKDWPGEEVKPLGDPKKTDKKIIEELEKRGKILSWSEYEHSYPHCWRCETSLLNYAAHSWFVKVTAIKDELIKNNQKINWVPEHVKGGRFGRWLEQARDWAISRSRYWGATLPVWVCNKCGEKVVVGSREELKKYSGKEVDDLHKQYVDEITWPCKCGGAMKRIPEVFDCWFESGAMPYGQAHYPFATEKFKEDSPVPADFIAEGIDQTRGWFYTMMVLSTALFGKEAAKNIIANGIVLSENGQKMSKRLKNYPDPSYIFERYSVDAMRYYLFASPVLAAENLNFSEDGVKESLRKIIMILWNVYKFYEMYEEVRSEKLVIPESENILDKWILARLNVLTKEVTENLENYNLPKALRPISEFINDFSTWYIRRSRERFKSESEAAKKQALDTTKYVLVQLTKVMAPFTPFIAETIWQKVTGYDFKDENKSVHLEAWPLPNPADEKNEKILRLMAEVRKIVELGLAARDEAGIKVRQILNGLKIFSYQLPSEYEQLIKDELNVKNITSEYGDGDIKVELDMAMTDELKLEGLKREIVRLVNNLRKQKGLTIKDKIILSWQSDSDLVKKVFKQMVEGLKKDTLSEEIFEGEGGEEVKVNGERVKLEIKKI